jgi:ABC-type sugar transport system ATPase subunit
MEDNQVNLESRKAIVMEKACLDFGGGAGVFDLNLALPNGSNLGLIGPSGCGKTTTIRMINGIYGTTSGEVRVFDKKPPVLIKPINRVLVISLNTLFYTRI